MQMEANEVWDIVSNMKQLVEKEPDKAKQMFVSHPQVKIFPVMSFFPMCMPQVSLGSASMLSVACAINLHVMGAVTIPQCRRILSCVASRTCSMHLQELPRKDSRDVEARVNVASAVGRGGWNVET